MNFIRKQSNNKKDFLYLPVWHHTSNKNLYHKFKNIIHTNIFGGFKDLYKINKDYIYIYTYM